MGFTCSESSPRSWTPCRTVQARPRAHRLSLSLSYPQLPPLHCRKLRVGYQQARLFDRMARRRLSPVVSTRPDAEMTRSCVYKSLWYIRQQYRQGGRLRCHMHTIRHSRAMSRAILLSVRRVLHSTCIPMLVSTRIGRPSWLLWTDTTRNSQLATCNSQPIEIDFEWMTAESPCELVRGTCPSRSYRRIDSVRDTST
jgi:hypothetical protein